MKTSRTGRGRVGARVRLGVVAIALLAASLTTGTSPASTGCSTPPPVTPVDDLHAGTTGTAYTVIQGMDPVSFQIEVLGVLKSAIGPGIDLILVKASGSVIDQTGGIAFGMSGSPVYVNGRLAGAVAYGSGGDPTIGGLTPAQPMVDILSYPESSAAQRTIAAIRSAGTIVIPRAVRRTAARAVGERLASFPTSVRQLDLPFAISGLSSVRLDQFAGRIAERALPFIPYAANSVPAPSSASAGPLAPGDSFAAMISYGDITAGALGTTTAVCGHYAVAFGHPFFFNGPTVLGMNAADVVTVITDPSQVWGPFKVGNVGDLVGTVDQDRLVGIRGIDGELPSLIPVTSDLSNPDLGRSRVGETDVLSLSQLPMIAQFHVQANLDVVFDRIGDGSLRLAWTMTGHRESGEEFTVRRANMWYSQDDAVAAGVFLIGSELDQIVFNGSEDVTIDGVDVTGSVTQQDLEATITRVLTSSSLQPGLRDRAELRVRPGSAVHVRVFLQPFEGGNQRKVDLTLRVPSTARGRGSLQVRGGRPPETCYYCYGGFEGGGGLDAVLADLQSREASFDLIATLFPRTYFTREKVDPQPDIVHGSFRIPVVVVR